MLDDRRRAEAWKRRAIDAERQRDQAEAELAHARDVLQLLGHLVAEQLDRLETFMFAAAQE